MSTIATLFRTPFADLKLDAPTEVKEVQPAPAPLLTPDAPPSGNVNAIANQVKESPARIIGRWASDEGDAKFGPRGTFVMDDMNGRYGLKGDRLVLSYETKNDGKNELDGKHEIAWSAAVSQDKLLMCAYLPTGHTEGIVGTWRAETSHTLKEGFAWSEPDRDGSRLAMRGWNTTRTVSTMQFFADGTFTQTDKRSGRSIEGSDVASEQAQEGTWRKLPGSDDHYEVTYLDGSVAKFTAIDGAFAFDAWVKKRA